MTFTVEQLVRIVQVSLPDDRAVTEAEVREAVDQVFTMPMVDPATRDLVRRRVEEQRVVEMPPGKSLVERHRPWLDGRRGNINWFYWQRYKTHLFKEGRPLAVVRTVDRNTDDILDLLGNPEEPGVWQRRGLVMGDVQSGKTQSYAALINKAADAGYRFIILLTGTIESLRRQTQERLDASFVGFDSKERLRRNNAANVGVGVGLIDATRNAAVFTSAAADFRASTVNALGLRLSALNEPAIVVVKKHTRILDNLRQWLTDYNTQGGQPIDLPLLLIDDEADNASVNTNDPTTAPTAVNASIRALLRLFRRNTYIGFTATPFANIFVNPDSTDEMIGDDLFPSDFIYAIEAPSNYFGPARVFVDDEGRERHVRPVADVADWLPARHRASANVEGLPESLLRALDAFIVVNAIRDHRGEPAAHRSMLVNVSPYTRVQDQVEALLNEELEQIKVAVRNFSALDPADALADPRMARLHEAWSREYAGGSAVWKDVQDRLHDAVAGIRTAAVNQRTGAGALDFSAHKAKGLRVIAVGGNSLSRGLTLEGLTVSYFRRNTQMYDTLLQMGRWFGYRTGYEDLCRVWLTPAASEWYAFISDATDELRSDFRRMYEARRPPREFGLAVRQDPSSLIVTARNKMRDTEVVSRSISISNKSFESVELPAEPARLRSNMQAVQAFLARAAAAGHRAFEGDSVGLHARDVGKGLVADLLRSFSVPDSEVRFRPEWIADHLAATTDPRLERWDVAVPGGSGSPTELCPGIEVQPQVRAFAVDRDGEGPRARPFRLVVSGQKRRVASRGAERAGLTQEQVARAESLAREEAIRNKKDPETVNVSDRYYRHVRSRPLLLIHVLSPKNEDDMVNDGFGALPLVAVQLSFPQLDGEAAGREVLYRLNLVAIREEFGADTEPDDDAVAIEAPA